jgi:hypothetical protein
MWMHSGPSCLDHLFSQSSVIQRSTPEFEGSLLMGFDLNLGSDLIPLWEGVDSPWVSLLGLSFDYLCRFLFLTICVFLCRISGTLTMPHGGSPYLWMW